MDSVSAAYPVPVPQTRIIGLDVLRVLGALAVVYIHAPETAPLLAWATWGRFAVPAFTTMSIVLLLMNLRRKPGPVRGPYVRSRFMRLYALFLVWNLVYLVARVAKKVLLTNTGDALLFSPGTILFSGFAEHLWYLSSLAWVTLLLAGGIWLFLRLNTPHGLWFSLVVAGMGGVLCTGACRIPIDLVAWPSSYFAAFSINNVAAACFALLVGWLWIYPLAQKANWRVCLVCAVGGFLALWLDTPANPRILWGAVSAPFFVLAALTFPVKTAPAALNVAAACALPIYCVHVLFIQGVQAVAHKLGFGSSLTLDALTLLVTITGSFLFGWLLQRLPTTSWFVALHR